MSYIRPAMSELKAISWIFSFVITKVAKVCRDFIVCMQGLEDDIKQKILHGEDLTLIELTTSANKIKESIDFLQHPNMHPDLWKVVQFAIDMFEERTGLVELQYAQGAMRSAEEAALKGDKAQTRQVAMANDVEDWASEISRAEAFASWYHYEMRDVAPVMGASNAILWDRTIRSEDFGKIIQEIDYHIEAGSVRKPNQERQVSNMTAAVQTILPILMQFVQISPSVIDQINRLIGDWAKSMDLDPEPYTIRLMPGGPAPGMLPPEAQIGPGGGLPVGATPVPPGPDPMGAMGMGPMGMPPLNQPAAGPIQS